MIAFPFTLVTFVAALLAGADARSHSRRSATPVAIAQGPWRIATPADHSLVWGPVRNKTTGEITLQVTDYTPESEASWFNLTTTKIPSKQQGLFDNAYVITGLEGFGKLEYKAGSGLVPSTHHGANRFEISCSTHNATMNTDCHFVAEVTPVQSYRIASTDKLGDNLHVVDFADCSSINCNWDMIKV